MFNLGDIRQYCEAHHVPCISLATEKFLRDRCTTHTPRTICEIGSAVGYSALVMAATIAPGGGHIWSVEYSFPDYQRACYYAHRLQQYNCTFYHADGNCIDYERICRQKMDLIYIDARKSDYLQYFHRVIDIVAPHTTIIFDDIIKYAHKTSSLYEYFAEKQIQYTIHQLDEDDGIMVIENAGLQMGM